MPPVSAGEETSPLRFAGLGIGVIRLGFGISHLLNCPADDPLVDAAIAAYRDRFATVGLFENRLYDGILEALEALAVHSSLFVVTSKPWVFAERIVPILA